VKAVCNTCFDEDLVTQLLDARADPNPENSHQDECGTNYGPSPLLLAVHNGCSPESKLFGRLLEAKKGAKTGAKTALESLACVTASSPAQTPLHRVCSAKAVQVLMGAGARPPANLVSIMGWDNITPLMTVARDVLSVEAVKLLLDAKASPSVVDYDAHNALFYVMDGHCTHWAEWEACLARENAAVVAKAEELSSAREDYDVQDNYFSEEGGNFLWGLKLQASWLFSPLLL
jgi:ankyrin repeat protein